MGIVNICNTYSFTYLPTYVHRYSHTHKRNHFIPILNILIKTLQYIMAHEYSKYLYLVNTSEVTG